MKKSVDINNKEEIISSDYNLKILSGFEHFPIEFGEFYLIIKNNILSLASYVSNTVFVYCTISEDMLEVINNENLAIMNMRNKKTYKGMISILVLKGVKFIPIKRYS